MKKIVRLSEQDLVRLVKRVIMEQDEKPVTVKELKRDGYDVSMGDNPLDSHKKETLIDSGITAVGQIDAGARSTFNELLKKKGINSQQRSKGFSVMRKLYNGNIEYKWIMIQQ
jgi:hypothetical protein